MTYIKLMQQEPHQKQMPSLHWEADTIRHITHTKNVVKN